MATQFTCDGCGTALDVPRRLGQVLRRDYCADCIERAKSFVDAEEGLRATLYDRFKTDRGLLISAASEGGFKLPDVP
jgi:hypothetical protein